MCYNLKKNKNDLLSNNGRSRGRRSPTPPPIARFALSHSTFILLQSDYDIFKNNLYNNFYELDNWNIILFNRMEEVRNEATQRQRNRVESDSGRGTQSVLDSNSEKDGTSPTGVQVVQPVASGDNQATDAPGSGIGHQDGKPSVDGAGLAVADKPGKLGGTDALGSREHPGRIPVVSEPAINGNMVQGREDANTNTVTAGTTDTSGVTTEPGIVGVHNKLDKLIAIPDDNLQVNYEPHSKSEALKTRIPKYQANSFKFIVMLL